MQRLWAAVLCVKDVDLGRVLFSNGQLELCLVCLEHPLTSGGHKRQLQHHHHVEVDDVVNLGGLVSRDGGEEGAVVARAHAVSRARVPPEVLHKLNPLKSVPKARVSGSTEKTSRLVYR